MNGYKRRNNEKESFLNCRRIENWREAKFYFILNVKVACSGKNLFAAKKIHKFRNAFRAYILPISNGCNENTGNKVKILFSF